MRHRDTGDAPGPHGGDGPAAAGSGGPWQGGETPPAVRGARKRPYADEGAWERDARVIDAEGAQTPRTARQHPWAAYGDGDGADTSAGRYASDPSTSPDPYAARRPDPADGYPDPDHPDAYDEYDYDEFDEDDRPVRRGRRRGLLTALLAIVAAGLATALTLSCLELRTLRENEAAGAAALAAARGCVADMLSYDHRHIEQNLARARGHATRRLADQYDRLAETLIPQARREQTIQQVSVAGASVESATAERVRVLMLINLTTSKLPPGARSRKGEVRQGRVRFVMVKGSDGAWRVDEVSTLLGNPPTRT